jgi:hypothetical protein
MHKPRPWTAEDIATLKDLAQKHRAVTIAARLRRSPSALAVKASELKLSLKTNARAAQAAASSGEDQRAADFNSHGWRLA